MKKLLAAREFLVRAACVASLCLSAQAQTLQSEDYIVNPGVLGPRNGINPDDDKIELYDNAAWGGTVGDSLIAEYREEISYSNVVHIRFTGLIASQWYDLVANMPYGADWDYSYISASDAVCTNRLVIDKATGAMYPGQADGNGNLSIYLGDLSNGGGGYRGIDSFTLTATNAPTNAPPFQPPKTYRVDFEDFIVNPEVLGSGINASDDKMEMYYGWGFPSLIAHYTEDIPLTNVVHIRLTGLGLDPKRSYDLVANMTYPADWDYSYMSAADAVGAAKLTLSKADGDMEDVVRDANGNISIYIGDLSNGGVGYLGIDYFTLRAGPLFPPDGTVLMLR